MKLLLDTHALLWWLDDDQRLGPAARGLLLDRSHDTYVSMVSLWEIVVKKRVGKLAVDFSEVLAETENQGFLLLDLLPSHLVALSGLPTHHRDPFDHLLIAQAIAEDAVFMSADARVPLYPVRLHACAA